MNLNPFNPIDRQAWAHLSKMRLRKSVRIANYARALLFVLLGIAAVTFSARANAADIAMMPNQAGGEIVLTNAQVPSCPDLYLLAYSRGWDGTMITGCWIVGERHVLIRWTETQTVKLFLITQFTVIGQEPEARPAAREFRL